MSLISGSARILANDRDYIRDWVEHKREAMHRFEEYSKARVEGLTEDQPTRRPLTKWIQ